MSVGQTLREATFQTLWLWFTSVGGLCGLIVMGIQGGILSVPIGMLIGIFVALAIDYHNVRRQRDDARSELMKLRGRANPAVVDALLRPLRHGTWLANRVKEMRSDKGAADWKSDYDTWVAGTKELMASLGCTPSEIARFSDSTYADRQATRVLDEDPRFNRRLQGLQVNIHALGRIIDGYSEHPSFD